jgi:acyl transferase domain-containing protein
MDKIVAPAYSGLEIAIIGMACRFPGAKNIAEFWENMQTGKETITFFTEDELLKEGVNPQLLADNNYVKAAAKIDNIEYFDAAFFGYPPKEAEILNPQIRVFYECVYEALEDAGYASDHYTGLIGLYAGATSLPAWDILTFISGKSDDLGSAAAGTLTEKDGLATRISYKLNLTGPAVSISTACSTSLVAIHIACRALLMKECDIALAGGVTIDNLEKKGYYYEKNLIVSPDGHCRPFDARAGGTVMGDGAGVLTLKKLKNAIEDHDHIYAVIKGSAINNDGYRKPGYTAPSVEGQADAIKAALKVAGAPPETVGFIETHGTATKLGDTIEIEALKMVFKNTPRHSRVLGAVKSNFGHLAAAAGVAGLIKTALILKHKIIPPTLFFETPNPELDLENSPFYVNTKLMEWKSSGAPLRAGVSSFGIGGTNAHAILEEYNGGGAAPEGALFEKTAPSTPGKTSHYLLLFSAKTPPALEQQTRDLTAYLDKNPGIDLRNVAYTLQTGRKVFRYRKTLVCRTTAEAVEELTKNSKKVKTASHKGDPPPIVFIITGQGGQYTNMGKDLYTNEPLFRRQMDISFEILKQLLGYNLKDILYGGGTAPGGVTIDDPEIVLAANFVFQYSLAQFLIQLGVKPTAMIGYSFGEYAAACLSGVLSWKDALELVTARGKLMRQTPTGAMLSVSLPEPEIRTLLEGSDLTLAINNGPSCIVAGTPEAVKSFENRMREKRLVCMTLNISHAAHSPMMNPVRNDFEEKVRRVKLNKPQVPYISNVTGTWITDRQALDPLYWGEHLCSTVRFSDGLNELLKIEGAIFIEIGPGRQLSNIVRQSIPGDQTTPREYKIINIVKHQQEKHPDDYYFLTKLGELWLYGAPIDWRAYYENEKPFRVSLPTYPFDRKRFWIEKAALADKLQLLAQFGLTGKGGNRDYTGNVNVPKPVEKVEDAEQMQYRYEGDNEDYEAPRNELETNIAEVWGKILGFTHIGIRDSFYDLNGDSLTATQMATRLQQVYPVEIPLRDFLEKPTIAELAELIKELLVQKLESLSGEELDALAQQELF